MGVHSLTTYLREKRRHLSSSIIFSNQPEDHVDASDRTNHVDRVNVVVDGWSMIVATYPGYMAANTRSL